MLAVLLRILKESASQVCDILTDEDIPTRLIIFRHYFIPHRIHILGVITKLIIMG